MKDAALRDDDASGASAGRYSAEERRRRIIAASGPRKGIKLLGDAVHDYWKESGLSRRTKESAVYDAVHQALGPVYSRHARAVKFVRGAVTVEVASTVHHAELNAFAGAGVVAAANAILGDRRISKIVYKSKG